MSWDEVGKQAKKAGIQIHRDRRHLDPVPPPPKAPGKVAGKSKTRKRYGFTYQVRFVYNDYIGKWRRENSSWYATERQRDDAIRGAHKGGYYEIRDVQPTTR